MEAGKIRRGENTLAEEKEDEFFISLTSWTDERGQSLQDGGGGREQVGQDGR